MSGHGPPMDPKFPAVSSEWPTSDELAAAGRIREANKDAIARLKDPAGDVVGDLRVVRFLRARHHNEAEATQWYAEFLIDRLDAHPEIETSVRPTVIGMSPDEFMTWFQERVHPSFIMYPWAGFTPDSVGVFIARPGNIDPVRFTEDREDIPLSQDSMLVVALLEWTLWFLDKESHRLQQMLYVVKIADMAGLGSDGRKLPIFVPKMKEFISSLIATMQKPYCEHDAMFIIVNAPFYFRMVWSVMSLLLTAKQKSKIVVLGNTSDEKVRIKLFEIVPANMLPKDLGGDMEVLQNIYPPRPASEIPAWIERIRGLQFWPPRASS